MNKSTVYYSFLFKYKKESYKACTLIIKSSKGDILYVPSERTYLNEDKYKKSIIDHISWHNSGRVHVKFKDNVKKYNIIEKSEQRENISKIKRQKLFSHSISNILALPKYNKSYRELDVVIDINKNKPVAIVCNLLDGKYCIDPKNHSYFNLSPIKDRLIKTFMRSISDGQINKSKVLQFIIYYLDRSDNKFNSCIQISYNERI